MHFPRLTSDPNLEVEPVDIQAHPPLAVTAAAMKTGGIDDTKIIEVLKTTWKTDHDLRVAAWAKQVADDEAEAAQLELVRATARMRIEKEEQEAFEKLKPSFPEMSPEIAVSNDDADYYAPGLMKTMKTGDYYPFAVLHPGARKNSLERNRKSIQTGAFVLKDAADGSVQLEKSMDSSLPRVKCDIDMTLEEILLTALSFETAMHKANFPADLIAEWMKFYGGLSSHKYRQDPEMHVVLVEFHARHRLAFFSVFMKSGKIPNPSVISQEMWDETVRDFQLGRIKKASVSLRS